LINDQMIPGGTDEIVTDKVDEEAGILIIGPHNTAIATIALSLVDQSLALGGLWSLSAPDAGATN
jgi:hypothetical protein